jgi:pyrroloquinoline-quinone synthase
MSWSPQEFHHQMLQLRNSYHLEHPFQVLMQEGKLNRFQMQGWVLNRFYYQQLIPLKDAVLLSKCPDRLVRQKWIQRIQDQDGTSAEPGGGGIEAWLQLGEAVGLHRKELLDLGHVLPGVKFACDAYLHFAQTAPWQETVCASLTELFAGEAHQKRMDSFPIHYPWMAESGLTYFKQRLSQCRRDVDHGLTLTLQHFTTSTSQQRALEILKFKMNILWSMLDAIHMYYVVEGNTTHAQFHWQL